MPGSRASFVNQALITTKQERSSMFDLKKGDQVLISGHIEYDKLQFVAKDYSGATGKKWHRTNNDQELLLNGGTTTRNALTASAATHCMYSGTGSPNRLTPLCEDLILSGEGVDVCANYKDGSGLACTDAPETASESRASIYKVNNANGYKPIIVTESSVGETYQYVSQCSNRGVCSLEFGICGCFTGYSGITCGTQNMKAA